MSDGQETESTNRPNAKYKLSNPDNRNVSEEGLVFYYNRERRLEKAPQAVQDLYKNKDTKNNRFSIFGPLLADKPRKMLFVSIIFLCAAILLLTFFGFFDTAYILEKNKIEINATVYEDSTIVVLRKIKNKTDAYSGAVDIAVSTVVQSPQEQFPVFTHRIFFTLENEEVYRFAVPFTSTEMIILLQNEINSIQIKFNPK